MAHLVDGKIYSLKEKSWHGLDIISNEPLSSEEIIKKINLDWNVVKEPLYLGDQTEVPNFFCNVREDNRKPLGIVKDRYEIVQNTEAFEFFDTVIGKDVIQYETAGSLKEGKKVFVTAKLKEGMKINGKDEHNLYLIFTNDHTGNSPLRIMLSSVRVVCHNTFTAAIQDSKKTNNAFSIRHTKSYKDKYAQAMNVLKISKNTFDTQQLYLQSLTKVKLADDVAYDLALKLICDQAELESLGTGEDIKEVLSTRKKNQFDKILDSYYSPQSQQNIVGTAYGFLNGITYYTSHVMYKDKEDSIDGHLFGGALNLQQKTINLLSTI